MLRPARYLVLALLLILPACVAHGNVYQVLKAKTEQDFKALFGHEYWAWSPILLSPTPVYCSSPTQDCHKVPGVGKFTVDGTADADQMSSVWAHFVFASGVSGYALTDLSDFGFIFKDHPQPPPPPPPPLTYPTFIDRLPAKEAARRRLLPGVELGMTEAQVLASAWGKPDRIKEIKKESSDRIGWYYPNGNALFFNFGQLYAIEK